MFKRLAVIFMMVLLQPSPTKADQALLKAINRAGAKITINSQHCAQSNDLGSYFWKERTIHLCLNRHNEDPDELLDTIKHEAVHHVQNCVNGLNIYREDFIRSQSTFSQRQAASRSSHSKLELEAYVVAANASTSDIIYLLEKYCANTR